MTSRFGWAAAVLATWGCAYSVPDPEPVQDRVALEAFDSCEALHRHIADRAVLDMRARLTDARDRVHEFGLMADETLARASQENGAAGSAGPSAWTTTNVQVRGVDEADFVKNDGTRIFVLSGRTLYLNRSWPADELQLTAKLTIEGLPREMFLDEKNRVIVFSSVALDYGNGTVKVADGADLPMGNADVARAPEYCGPWSDCGQWNTVKATVVDVSDLSAPRVVREEYLPGDYVNARRIGSSVRLVLRDHMRWPEGVRFHLDRSSRVYEDRTRTAAAFEELMDANEKLIRAQPLDKWLPAGRRRTPQGESVLPYRCEDFRRSSAPARLGLATVATINLDEERDPSRASIIADVGEIYSSHSALYLASRHWWWWPRAGQTDHTYLHKFDITDPNAAVYVGSGGVEGHILDQFSLDEHDGFLRVATTLTILDEAAFAGRRRQSANRVSVLAERAGALEVVGRTEDLAPGERIYSARFLGPRAFVVTFRQTDPLFAIDLSDPASPRKVGELHVPGFSTYLHPIDDKHLLAIGTYMPDPNSPSANDWRVRALKLTVYDVGDLEQPKQVHEVLVGTSSAYSEAQYDHRAFNWFPEKRLLAIPFIDWGWGGEYWNGFRSELRVFHVDAAQGITPQGALSMADVFAVHQYNSWSWYWYPAVRRSVMADDFVYAVSDAGIRSARLGSLGTPLKTVQFERFDGRF